MVSSLKEEWLHSAFQSFIQLTLDVMFPSQQEKKKKKKKLCQWFSMTFSVPLLVLAILSTQSSSSLRST